MSNIVDQLTNEMQRLRIEHDLLKAKYEALLSWARYADRGLSYYKYLSDLVAIREAAPADVRGEAA